MSEEPCTRVTRVRHDGKRTTVIYEVERPDGGDWDEFSMSSCERPSGGFLQALVSLRPHVRIWIDLPPSVWDRFEAVTIRGANFTYEHSIMGATVTALVHVQTSAAPLVINTPHRTVEHYGKEGIDDHLIPPKTVTALELLQREAMRYVAGRRAQELLPFQRVDVLA